MALSKEKIIQSLQDGLLSFPVTDMDENEKFSEAIPTEKEFGRRPVH